MTKEEWKARAKAAEKRLAELLPVRSHEQYEADKAAGINRVGKPYDGKASVTSSTDDKPLFPEKPPREDDDVLPLLAPRDWAEDH